MSEHSLLGPSSLYRTLACPASFQLAQTLPPGKSSVYAVEGTVAHQIIETQLADDMVLSREYNLGDVVEQEGHEITVDQDMLDGVEVMVTFCESLKQDASHVWVEQRVTLDHLWEGGPPVPIFGTVDFGAYHPTDDVLYCVDFKYGRLSVTPHDNPQPLAYSSGMVHELGFMPARIVNVIVQPRDMDHPRWPIKVAELTGLDLLAWQHDTLIPGVQRTADPAPPLVAGDHCRFCPAKSVCPALVAVAQDKARAEFGNLPLQALHYSDEELGDVMNWAATLKLWIDSIQAEASQRIEHGCEIPNWKLVPKRALRKWTNKEDVVDAAKDHEGATIQTPLSPAQMQKKFPDLYKQLDAAGWIDATSSGTTLAPDNDPREAVKARSAKDDFAPV